MRRAPPASPRRLANMRPQRAIKMPLFFRREERSSSLEDSILHHLMTEMRFYQRAYMCAIHVCRCT